jgi:CBS domain containing-hemolysin-like protein
MSHGVNCRQLPTHTHDLPMMKPIMQTLLSGKRFPPSRWLAGEFLALLALLALLPSHAHASLFKGEMLDQVADIMTWVVLVVAPAVGIAVFWLVHILPEKVAEKRQHPQAKAIQTLCLLSLFFGGMLWPLAWLWAYSKPVLYRMAYGTDKVAHDTDTAASGTDTMASGHGTTTQSETDKSEAEEIKQLRQRLAELESRLASKSAAGAVEA